jgi:hypothetical protein
MFEDLYARRDEVAADLKNVSGARERLELMEALQSLDEALGDRRASTEEDGPMITGDPLIDKWEREFAEGKVPNLDEAS